MTRWRVVVIAVFAVALSNQRPLESQDRAVAVPEMKVLLQNERVRVQFHDVAVGETTPMHSHPAYVAYVFNEYTGKAILADGREVLLARKAGDVFYNGAVTHRIANTGRTPIHNLIVELRDPASSLALGTDLKITDSRGTEVVVAGATVDYSGLMASDRLTEGIRVLQGDGVVVLKWTEVESLKVTRTDASVKPPRIELEITLRSGKKVPAALFRQGQMKLSGKTELGGYSIDLDKVRTIVPVR